MSGPPDLRPVEHVSAVGFVPTLERLVQAIETAGMTVFARIDHAAGAGAAPVDRGDPAWW
jgi:uncharacterized protein (DUF302 family)